MEYSDSRIFLKISNLKETMKEEWKELSAWIKLETLGGHFVELILNSFEHFERWRKIIAIFLEIFFGKLSFEHLRKKRNLENIRYSSKFLKKTWKSEHKIELKKKKRQGEY